MPSLWQTQSDPQQVGKTDHDVGGLACILGLTNSHNQSLQALSNRAIQKLRLQVSGRISVLMSTFSVFGLSYGRSDNEFCAEEGQNPIFDRIQGRDSILVTRDRRDSNYNENRVRLLLNKHS